MKDDDDDDRPGGFNAFVDRDDDGSDDLSDRDSDDAPGGPDKGTPDPGFAASRDENDDFEDPLEDWPGTEEDDRPLEALAEDLAASLDDFTPQRAATTPTAPAVEEDQRAAEAWPDPGVQDPALPDDAELAFAGLEDNGSDDRQPFSVDTDEVLPEYPPPAIEDAADKAIDEALESAAPAAPPAPETPPDIGETRTPDASEIDAGMIESLLDDDPLPDAERADHPELEPAAPELPEEPWREEPSTADEVATGTRSGVYRPDPVDEAVIDALAEEEFGSDAASAPGLGVSPANERSPKDRNDAIADPTADTDAPRQPSLQDDLVDDFLSDLDDDDEYLSDRGAPVYELPPLPAQALVTAVPDVADVPTTRPGASETGGSAAQPRKEQTPMRDDVDAAPNEPEDGDSGRKLPWGMIASLALAVTLLVVGGYGVLEQRGAMQQEIRELQASLSTAMSTEDAQAFRERQAQLELRNDNLSTEVERLRAEQQQRIARIEELEQTLDSSRAELDAARERAERAAAEAEQAAAATAARQNAVSSAPPAAASGRWFVNFGSYAARAIAEDWSRRLQTNAGRVVIQEATADGRSLYRLRVVGLGDRDQAESVATELERRFDLPRLWVGRQ